jgi:hypothetical protein
MKQSVSPVVVGIAIVVVVALAGFFGYRALAPNVNTKTVSKEDYSARMNQLYGKQQQGMDTKARRGPGGAGYQGQQSGMGSGGGMTGGSGGGMSGGR